MKRAPNMVIESAFTGRRVLEETPPPEAPRPIAGLALFLDLSGAVCGQVPAASLPDCGAVLVGSRVFVRSGPAGFREVAAVEASMP